MVRSPGRTRSASSVIAVLVEDLGADRHLEDDVGGAGAGALAAHAVPAVLRPEVALVAVVDQGVEAFDRLDDDVAAVAAVAAVRAAELDELLAPEGQAAVAAVAALHEDLGLVDEPHGPNPLLRPPRRPRSATPPDAVQASGSTEMKVRPR